MLYQIDAMTNNDVITTNEVSIRLHTSFNRTQTKITDATVAENCETVQKIYHLRRSSAEVKQTGALANCMVANVSA